MNQLQITNKIKDRLGLSHVAKATATLCKSLATVTRENSQVANEDRQDQALIAIECFLEPLGLVIKKKTKPKTKAKKTGA